MNKGVGRDLEKGIRLIYEDMTGGKAFFDWAAARTNDAAETSVDRMSQVAEITRYEAIELAKALGEAGCGEYIVGRKGWKTRISWAYSLRSLGKAASGEQVELEEVDPELAEDVSDQLGHLPEMPSSGQPFTIAEAKRRLSDALGLSPDAIEITIRA